MRSKLGPNYACLFVGYVEEQMLRNYTGIKADLYKRNMDDLASCTEDGLTQFLTFAFSNLRTHGQSSLLNSCSWICTSQTH